MCFYLLGKNLAQAAESDIKPYHRISGIVAVNMIMAGAAGGVVAIAIAVWAQVKHRWYGDTEPNYRKSPYQNSNSNTTVLTNCVKD